MQFKELLKGIDSLYVSYTGTLKESIAVDLLEKKHLLSLKTKKNRH
ncbi:MAG: hypothetical protein NG784_12015 [Candidatus Jettenia sp.]|nr:hypothetical protein [Candidatus Jettenia sp.]